MSFPSQKVLYQVTQGDEAAFQQLCSYFQVPAFKFCAVILKDENEAESIIQDVFAKIWNDRFNLKPEENFQSYLFLNLKDQIFSQMQKYTDPASCKRYLDRIQAKAQN